MELNISVREANQHLSRYLDKVERGDEVVITRRGAPVARLVGTGGTRVLTEAQRVVREQMRKRMAEGYALGGEKLDRDAMHERG